MKLNEWELEIKREQTDKTDMFAQEHLLFLDFIY